MHCVLECALRQKARLKAKIGLNLVCSLFLRYYRPVLPVVECLKSVILYIIPVLAGRQVGSHLLLHGVSGNLVSGVHFDVLTLQRSMGGHPRFVKKYNDSTSVWMNIKDGLPSEDNTESKL